MYIISLSMLACVIVMIETSNLRLTLSYAIQKSALLGSTPEQSVGNIHSRG